ncbi:unnamed protein product [Larinioides sclopetarius]|uniref:Uncharacterized protein n=1 Tax=Larinioides sclopetarius TaxID=280406 RepID=A0AAV1YPQ5_9ARAC
MDNQDIYLSNYSELLNSTISLLETAQRDVTLKDEYRNLILILGDKANDFSLIQSITGDYTNATATEVGRSFDEFLYEPRQFGDFIFKYQKRCPESIAEAKPNVLYYGCSCFSGIRSTSVDIVNTFITNKVLSHVDRIKIVFTVNYASLEKGADKGVFMKFLRYVSDFVKDIEKYRNSLAIIAIGVGEENLKKGEDSQLIGDIQFENDIADFLLGMRQHINDKQKDPDISSQDKTFYENASQFINAVLEKDGENYTKIGIFRKSDELKSRSNPAVHKEWKNNIEKMLNDELNFTEKLDRDFRCSISENSEQNVNNLEEELNNAVWIGVRRISATVHEHYKNQIQKLLRKLENFASGKTIVQADPVEAVSLSFKFKNDYYTITSFVGALQNSLKVKELVKKIKDFVSTLDISVPDIEIQNISRYRKYIDIIETVSGKEFGTKPWGDLFKSLEEYIFESRKIIENAIDTAVEKVKYCIKLNLASIANRMQKKYSEEWKAKFTTKTLEIQKLHDAFLKQYEDIVKLTEDVKRLSTVDSLVKKLQVNSNIPGIVASRRYITNISNEGRCFMFLHFLSEKSLDNGSSTWWKGFQEVSDIVHDSKKWYGFLSDLNIKFSEYNTQIERKKYIDFLKHQTESDVFQETNITPINFEIFLRKMRNLNVMEYDNIMNVSLTESRLKELNQLINFKLKHDITIQCSDTHMFVKGDFVSLQEVRSRLLNHNDKKCKEFKYYGPPRKFVNIFALNTLFIDRDIELQASKMQLIYISPRWEIIGKRVINLNGYDSSKHISTRARDSYKPGSDGDHGNPGKPGGSGGIFFGIGAAFVNGDNLTITANGGDGGPGQNGGNGSEGISGVYVNLPIEERNSIHCCYPKTTEDLESSEMEKRIAGPSEGATFYDLFLSMEALERRGRMSKIYQETKNGFGCEGNSTEVEKKIFSLSNFSTSVYSREIYNLYGKPGKKGGNGGNGGKGGIGGNPGIVRIVSMENSSGMNTSAIKGKDGAKGEGGKGGNGGKDGDNASAICSIEKKRSCDWCLTVSWVLNQRVVNDRRGLSGRNGKNGVNDTNIENPEPEIFIEEPAKIINKYKIYLRENLTNDLKMFYLKKFYEQMNNNYAVRSVYDLEGLVSEFIDLEDHYDLLKKQVDFYPFYKNLLERLVEIYECTENCDVSRENKIVLSYFYSAVLSKINSLKENNESDLIIDIEKYFDTIKTEIYLLQDIQNKNSKAKAVDEMKKEFKKRIDEKIQEAKYFIENTVDPEINRINSEIDNKIDLLIIETISLQKQTQIEKNKLKKKKEDLKKALKLKKVFDFFKVLGRVISFLGPYGMAIGAAIELGTSVGESFALGNKVKPVYLSNTAAKLNAVENNIKMMRIRKTDYLNNVLTEISEKTFKYPGELGGISSKVTDMKKRLNDIRTGKVQYKEVRKLEIELKDTLKTKEIELKSQVKKTSRDITKMIKKFGQALEVGSMFVDIYNRNKEEDEKIAAINEAIQQKENELIMLREYEKRSQRSSGIF